jgi:hypothetical protein
VVISSAPIQESLRLAQAAAIKVPFDLTCWSILWDGEAKLAAGLQTVKGSTSIAILIPGEYGRQELRASPESSVNSLK